MATKRTKGAAKKKSARKPAKKKTTAKPKTAVPESRLFNTSQLAEKFNMHRNSVAAMLKKHGINPVVEQPRKKLYDLEAAAPVLDNEDYEKARARKMKADADLKEHQLAVKQGEFASVEEFTDITQRIFGKLYNRCAVQLPRRVASKLKKAKNVTEIKAILARELENEFQNLRTDFQKYL